MDCIESIIKSIDFIENNLLENITYADAARSVYISSYHFHRLFSMLTGITPSEYIRARRLSIASQELTFGDAKVIDIALKYGYDSPESFTKAFTRFHGITPSVAKRSGAKLKSYNRLTLNITKQGGNNMDYKIVKQEPFKILARVKKFDNEIISRDDSTDIPDFWKACGKDDTFDVLKKHTEKCEYYGVCTPVSKESNLFDYGIGVKYDSKAVPDGFELMNVKPTLWAVFQCKGENPDCISAVWDKIFKEFLPSSQYNMLDDVDYELYPENGESDLFCEVWIPVENKNA